MSIAKKRLPREVFDALHLAALEFGGVGARLAADNDGNPCCIHGLAEWIDGVEYQERRGSPSVLMTPTREALYNANISVIGTDWLLKGLPEGERLDFEDWCAKVGVDVAPEDTP